MFTHVVRWFSLVFQLISCKTMHAWLEIIVPSRYSMRFDRAQWTFLATTSGQLIRDRCTFRLPANRKKGAREGTLTTKQDIASVSDLKWPTRSTTYLARRCNSETESKWWGWRTITISWEWIALCSTQKSACLCLQLKITVKIDEMSTVGWTYMKMYENLI